MSEREGAASVAIDVRRQRLRRPFRTKHFGTKADPYLDRTVIISTPWFGVYLHHIWREDRDDYPHDHPWPFATLILRGGYVEEWFEHAHRWASLKRRWRAGSVPPDAAALGPPDRLREARYDDARAAWPSPR